MKIDTRIKLVYQNLTKSEKKVADFILKQRLKFYNNTLKESAVAIGVSEATIIRFLNKNSYNSLYDLKYDIRKEFEDEKNSYVQLEDNYIDQLRYVVKNEVDNTLMNIDVEKVAEVVSLIKNQDMIYILGIGHSGLVANIAEYRMLRYGIEAKSITDMHYQAIQATLTKQNDLFIAISLSGESPELNGAVKTVKEKGGVVIAIISNANSSLGKLADYTFLATSKDVIRRYAGAGIDSMITQLLVIESIIAQYSHDDKENIEKLSKQLTLSFRSQRKF